MLNKIDLPLTTQYGTMNAPFPNDFGFDSQPFRMMIDHAHNNDRSAAVAAGRCYLLESTLPCRIWFTRHFYPNMITDALENNLNNLIDHNMLMNNNNIQG